MEERLPLEQIASMYKVTRYRITVALHEASVKIRTRWESNTKTTRISKEVIIEALNNEGSLRKAAKYLGITYNTYRSTCIQYHIEYNSSKSVRQ